MNMPSRSRKGITRATFSACAILTFGLLTAATTGYGSAEIGPVVEYFAGKDELCTATQRTRMRAVPRRLIIIVDYYGKSDRELYCTVVMVESGRSSEEVRYSASKQHCLALLKLDGLPMLDLEIVKDHLCAFSASTEIPVP